MRKFNVNVNGNSYEVEVEEIKDGVPVATPQATIPQSAPKTETVTPTSSPSANGEKVTAPMPGTVLDIKVTVGQTVAKGDVLVVLEAMKMENEIKANVDGVIGSIEVSKSSVVETGQALVIFK